MEYEGYMVRGFNDYLDSYITQKRALMGEPFDHGTIPTQSNPTISLKEQSIKDDITEREMYRNDYLPYTEYGAASQGTPNPKLTYRHKPTGNPTIDHDTAPYEAGKYGTPWEKLVQGYNRYKGWAGFGGGLLASTLLLNRLSSPPRRKKKKKR